MIKKHKVLLYCPAIIVLLFNLTFFNRYFPLTEGWYETYAYLVKRGLVPYKDFNIPFPPFYVLFNVICQNVIGHNFLLLRLMGVFFNVLVVFLLQIFLERFFRRQVAFTAALFASFLSISSPVFIAKDYHTFVDLFVISSLLIAQSMIRKREDLLDYKYSGKISSRILLIMCPFMLGVFVGLLALTKQNIGIFLFLSYILCIVTTPFSSMKGRLFSLMTYIAGFTSMFGGLFVYAAINDIPYGALSALFIGNDSKGSLFVILTRILSEPYNLKVIIISICLSITYLLFNYYPGYKPLKTHLESSKYKDPVIVTGLMMIFFLGLTQCTISKHLSYHKIIIPLSLSVLFFMFFRTYLLEGHERIPAKYKFAVIPLLVLVYCNTQTAGLNYTGMYFIIAFSFGILLNKLLSESSISPVWFYAAFLCVIPSVVVKKHICPYSWWKLEQTNTFGAKQKLPYPSIKGVFVDVSTKEAFDTIKTAIETYSKSENDVYLFPHIPIFYYLHNKIPPFGNVVQWYDVISSSQIREELKAFKNNPPQLAIFLDQPYFVYEGHANMIKRQLVQEEFRDEFDRLFRSGFYELSAYRVYDELSAYRCEQNRLTRYCEKITSETVVVANNHYIGKPISILLGEFGSPSSLVVHDLIRDGLSLRGQFNGNTVLQRADILEISIREDQLKNFAEKVGYLNSRKYYALKIYHKRTQ